MASELRVNTLKDASGNNSVGMAYVAGGSAKAWSNYNQVTPAVTGSFNISSVTDVSSGKHTVNFTSSMSDTTYAAATYVRRNTDNDASGACLISNSTDTKTTSAMKFKTNYLDGGTSANGLTDYSENGHHFMGDLA